MFPLVCIIYMHLFQGYHSENTAFVFDGKQSDLIIKILKETFLRMSYYENGQLFSFGFLSSVLQSGYLNLTAYQ